MSIFKPIPKPSKLKMGIFAETGAGKTFTAGLIMAGLHKMCKAQKPIFAFDTEGGFGFIKEMIFDKHKIPVEICASTSFNDLCEGLKEAEMASFGVIIDQESRYWDEFKKQYMKDTKQSYLSVGDWGILKPKWAQYNYLYLNTNIHIIKLGRSGNIFESTEEIVGGKKKTGFSKVGTKFRSESESGYEPSLLCEMEKVYNDGDGTYSRVMHVVKDRFNVIDSQSFVNPKFDDFLPHINKLDLGGTQSVILNPDNPVFDINGDDELSKRARRRSILCEELQGLIVSYLPGQDAKQKKAKGDVIFKLFGVRAWLSVEQDWKAVPIEKLEEVYKQGENHEPSIAEQTIITVCEQLQGAAV